MIVGPSQGRSAAFATAQTNQTALTGESFLLTKKSDYSVASIDGQTMASGATDKGAFLKTAKMLIDNAIKAITLSISSALFRSGTGSIGKISSISTGVITLVDPNSVVQFEIGATLQANS